MSRRDPPDCYARLLANDRVDLIDWDKLKLTLEEACAIGQLRHQLSRDEIARLHERSEGWAAGLVLMLEWLKRGKEPFDEAAPDSLREVFNYFAAQLVEQFDPDAQRALMKISYLPRMSAAMAVAISSTPSAAALLEELHRRHLFTERRAAQEPVYQFHALFQAFLQYRAEQTLDSQEQSTCATHAARLLEESGSLEDAFPLALRGGDIAVAVAIVHKHAARLIGQGRWRTVADWIGALSVETVASDRWLQYWMGRACMAVTPIEARTHAEAGYRIAVSASDHQCVLLSAAAVVESHILAHTDFRPLDPWIEVILVALKHGNAFETTDAEVKVLSALLIALSYRRPDEPELDACAERVFELLPTVTDVNLRLSATAHLLGWGSTTGPIEVANRAVPLLRAVVSESGVTATNAAFGWFLISWYHCLLRQHRESRTAIERVEEIARVEALPTARKFGPIISTWLELHAGNLPAARAEADRLEGLINPGHLYDAASVAGIRAWLAVLENQPDVALTHASAAVEVFDRSGSLMHQVNHRLPGIWARILQRDFADARARVDEMRRLATRTRSNWQEMELRATEAWMALQEHDQAGALRHLRGMMRLARERNLDHVFGRNLQPWMPELCAAALEARIEVEYVRAQVRRWGWLPPRRRLEQWPWPIRLYTLDQFRLLVDDKPVVFSRKTPKKPIALLKAIVAMGGRDVGSDLLADALWPELEGDAGEEAFNQTLHRLRRLLGPADAVQLEDGKASLNDALIWTDVRAFEELVGQDQPNGDHEALFRLYRGQFLAEEPEAGWAVSMRERLRGKFIHKVEQAGVRLESAGRWYDAIALYLRGLDADSLNEAFYQGLMRCYAGLGNRAEALSVYRRLREQLSIVLGMKPSSSSETLARELRLQ